MTTVTHDPIESRPTEAHSVGLGVTIFSGAGIFLALSFGSQASSFIDYALCAVFAVMGGLLCGFLAFLTVGAWGLRGAPVRQARGIVTAKYFSDSSLSVGVGVGAGGSPVVTATPKPEQYTIEVRLAGTGAKVRQSVDGENFDALEVGDPVVMRYRISRTTGETHWADEIALESPIEALKAK